MDQASIVPRSGQCLPAVSTCFISIDSYIGETIIVHADKAGTGGSRQVV